jgi:hypothetical protein
MHGTVNLSEVTEKQFDQILQFKLAHEGKFAFDPTQAKTSGNTAQPSGVLYYNVILGWSTDEGMKLVIEALSNLLSE